MKAKSKTSSSVAVLVEFGNPTIKCARFGICQMSMAGVEKKKCKGLQQAAGILEVNEDMLVLTFRKTDLTVNQLSKYFNGGFLVDVNTKIPSDILNKIGRDEFVVPKGMYEVKENSQSVWVIFVMIKN